MFDILEVKDSSLFNHDEIYPVGKFLKICNRIINNSTPLLWISGEISNLYKHKSGHTYFSLKDDDGLLRCTLFRLSARKIKFDLKDGMQVMVYGKAFLYEVKGDLQLNVNNIEPIGIGGIELALKQLKEKLSKQGLFEQKYKKPINKFPHKIAIITSKTGAVIQDIIKVMQIRYPYAALFIYDVNTQGNQAITQIIKALNIADNKGYDTIIIARGGGSTEDLYIFNDEDLAINVFNAKTPIISSIGHEVDITIIDLVADKSASTPSAAAMLASSDKLELSRQHKIIHKRLLSALFANMAKQKQYFDSIKSRFKKPNLATNYLTITNNKLKIQALANKKYEEEVYRLNKIYTLLFKNSPKNSLENKQNINSKYQQKLHTNINNYINQQQSKLKTLSDKLINQMDLMINNSYYNFNKNINALEYLSPLKVLSRGYSITLKNNVAIKSSKDVDIGDEIQTKLQDGIIMAKITKC